ncbi:MAG: hypothetical protein H6644_13150 [Caldilineaceae bacterium]|nr:hypothetical protein [Caldilineaceae bacterium]
MAVYIVLAVDTDGHKNSSMWVGDGEAPTSVSVLSDLQNRGVERHPHLLWTGSMGSLGPSKYLSGPLSAVHHPPDSPYCAT